VIGISVVGSQRARARSWPRHGFGRVAAVGTPASDEMECTCTDQGRVMPEFRCDMLDEHGHTLFSADIIAEDLEGAVRHAFDILRTSNQSSSSRQVYSFEVWRGTSRLFPSHPNAKLGTR